MTCYTRDQSCYVLSVPSGYMKVGISDNVERRIREIQAQFYEPVSLVTETMISRASPVSAFEMERLIHAKLAPRRTPRREWFSISPEELMPICLGVYWFLAMPIGHKDWSRVAPDWRGQNTRAPGRARTAQACGAPVGTPEALVNQVPPPARRLRGRPRIRTPEERKAFRAALMRKKRAEQKGQT